MKRTQPPYTRNNGKRWDRRGIRLLRSLARQNTPLRVIVLKLGRTEPAVRTRASLEGVSLRRTNQSPYARRRT